MWKGTQVSQKSHDVNVGFLTAFWQLSADPWTFDKVWGCRRGRSATSKSVEPETGADHKHQSRAEKTGGLHVCGMPCAVYIDANGLMGLRILCAVVMGLMMSRMLCNKLPPLRGATNRSSVLDKAYELLGAWLVAVAEGRFFVI